jgi:hypothetical protein
MTGQAGSLIGAMWGEVVVRRLRAYVARQHMAGVPIVAIKLRSIDLAAARGHLSARTEEPFWLCAGERRVRIEGRPCH